MRSLVLAAVAVVVLVCVVLGWSAFRERPDERREAPDETPIEAAHTEPTAVDIAARVERVERVEIDTPDAATTGFDANARDAQRRLRLDVRVVSDDDAPVAGAVVTWVAAVTRIARTPAEYPPHPWTETREQQFARAAALGGHAKTDRNGFAGVRVDDEPTLRIAAWTDDAFGSVDVSTAQIEAGHPCTVRIRPSQTYVLRMRDHAGRPAAGVLVHAVARRPTERAAPTMGASISAGRTDDDGVLRVHHFARFASELASDDDAIDLIPRILGLGAVLHSLDPRGNADAPDEWTLPPTGRVVVTLADGAPMPTTITALQVSAIRSEPEFALSPSSPSLPHVVPHVGLGQRFRARMTTTDGAGQLPIVWTATSDGPTLVDETVTLTLARDSSPALVGRVVDPSGAPLQGTQIRFEADAKPLRMSGEVRLGRFHVAVPTSRVDSVVEDVRVVLLAERMVIAEGRLATVRLPPHAANDLGDVVLTLLPTLVAGKVTIDGAPAAAHPVMVEALDPETQEWRGLLRWHETAADGTFRLQHVHTNRALRLVVASRETTPVAPIPFTFGAQDVAVALTRGVALRVLVTIPSEHGRRSLRRLPTMRLVAADASRPGDSRPSVALARRTAFDGGLVLGADLLGLRPGRYRIEIASGFGGASLFADEVVLDAASDVGEPTIVAVDLRSKTRIVALTIEVTGDRAGQWAGRLVAAEAEIQPLEIRRGVTTLLVDNDGVDVAVTTTDGKLVEALPRLREDTTVRVEPIPMTGIEIRVPALRELPEGFSADAMVVTTEMREPRIRALTRDGAAEMTLPAKRNYRMSITLRGPGGQATMTPTPIEIDMTNGPPAAPITVEVAPEVVAKALADLATRKR